MVHFTETWPIFSLVHVNKCGEVKCCVEADVLASCLFSGVKEEVSDALVNGSYVFEFCDKWTDVLKSCTSYNLRGGVLEELKVQFLHIRCLLLQRAYLSDFSNHISACLAHLLFFVLCQFLVKREDLVAEAINFHIFAHV